MPNILQLGEICRLLGISERVGRYVLEQGFIPQGVDEAPQSGNHRRFGPAQAFWLAMVLKLKENGLPVPLAATMANHGQEALRSVTQNLNWDSRFLPSAGRFNTDRQYFLEVGDKKYIRLVTDANPSGGGQLEALPWRDADDARKVVGQQSPYLVMRLDLTRVAHDLASAFATHSGFPKEGQAE
ncbi:MerR family transcriptional regulator [Planctomicrobium sp. SH527]|uniref:MerR family transcriptional regulator n=1 Tax=Planctomicrobium sp. SH527 TaxID=3448123 RepID=UPI003F5C0707